MKKFMVLFLALLIGVAGSFMGCTTDYTQGITALNSSYSDYTHSRSAIDHDTIVAMMAYTSAHVNTMRSPTVRALKADLMGMISDMESNGEVARSYPVKPKDIELKYVRDFVQRFCVYANSARFSGTRLQQEYSMYVGSLISRIHDLEYTGPR